MKADLKAKWIEALRSGEYEQASGQLRLDGAYCCLGVLCEVAGIPINESGDGVGNGFRYDYDPIYYLVGGRDASIECSLRNDGGASMKRHSFAELADYIEANIPADPEQAHG